VNTQEYIASGILELYASGGLPVEERAEVEANLLQHPEIREELNRIEGTLESYAQLHATNPPAELKARILNSIHANSGQTKNKIPVIPEIDARVSEPKVIPFSQPSAPESKTSSSFNSSMSFLMTLPRAADAMNIPVPIRPFFKKSFLSMLL